MTVLYRLNVFQADLPSEQINSKLLVDGKKSETLEGFPFFLDDQNKQIGCPRSTMVLPRCTLLRFDKKTLLEGPSEFYVDCECLHLEIPSSPTWLSLRVSSVGIGTLNNWLKRWLHINPRWQLLCPLLFNRLFQRFLPLPAACIINQEVAEMHRNWSAIVAEDVPKRFSSVSF